MPIWAEQFVGGEEALHKSAQMWRFIPQAWANLVDNLDSRAIEEAEATIPHKQVANHR